MIWGDYSAGTGGYDLPPSAPSTSSWRFGHLSCGKVANPTTLSGYNSLKLTDSSHLQNGGWKTSYLLGWPIFRDYLSFREGNILFILLMKRCWNYFAKKYWRKLRCVNSGQICHISLWHINKTSVYEIWYVFFWHMLVLDLHQLVFGQSNLSKIWTTHWIHLFFH